MIPAPASATEALLDRIPALGRRPRTVEDLPGGLTNRNLKVTTPDGTFVVRISGANAAALGIDREAEAHDSRMAEVAGVGAPVVDHHPELGVLVVRWLEARALTNADLARPDVVRRVAVAVRALHAGPRFRRDFDMVALQRGYLATVLAAGYRLPDGYRDHEPVFGRVRDALAARPVATVPCNNDLLAGNLLDDGHRVWLIDYEYAGNNDPCFELGNLAGECDLDAGGLALLVEEYAGGPRPDLVARARLQCAVGQYGWALWGSIQAEVSPLDFDFRGWGAERYEKAVALFTSSELDRLLAVLAA